MEDNHKEALKLLRKERAVQVERARNTIKQNNKLFKKIKARIKDQPMTIPEIAAATGEPSAKVLVYVSGLKKFGLAVEKEKEGDYFKYQLSSEN